MQTFGMNEDMFSDFYQIGGYSNFRGNKGNLIKDKRRKKISLKEKLIQEQKEQLKSDIQEMNEIDKTVEDYRQEIADKSISKQMKNKGLLLSLLGVVIVAGVVTLIRMK
tara:strand:+ start:3252 stop:3578 length:327 start_codon:yes stop_codon:yes gene_type:complete